MSYRRVGVFFMAAAILLSFPDDGAAQRSDAMTEIGTYEEWTAVSYDAVGEVSFRGAMIEGEEGNNRLLVRCLRRGTTGIVLRTAEFISAFEKNRLTVGYGFDGQEVREVSWAITPAGIGGSELILSSPSYPDEVEHFLSQAPKHDGVRLIVEGRYGDVTKLSFSLAGFGQAYREACGDDTASRNDE